jgi:sugar phosphate isomerase/epimerase
MSIALSRRDFLKRGAVVAWGVLGCGHAKAVGGNSAVDPIGAARLGYSLYGMKSLPLLSALEQVRAIGYGNVELCLNKGFACEPASFSKAERRAVRGRVRDLGLGVSCYMSDLQLFGSKADHAANLEAIARAGDVAGDITPGLDAPLESVLGGKPEDWVDEKDRAADRLREWGETADEAGISIAIKGHAGGAVRLPSQLRWLIEKARHPRIVVNFDQSHYQLERIPLAESLAALHPWIRMGHVKDSRGTATDFHFLAAGEGRTDYREYFRALKAVGFTGPLVAEISSQISTRPGYDAVAVARRAYHALLPAVQATFPA